MTRTILLITALLSVASCQKEKPRNAKITPVSTKTDSPGVRRAMARAMQSQGNYQDAVEMLRQALKEEGGQGNSETHTLLGISLRELRFFPEAEESLKTAIKINKKNAEAWNALGVLRQVSGQDGATEAFREACKFAPDLAEYHNNLGFSLYLAKQYKEASESLRRAVTIAPDVPRFRNNLGFALGANGLYDDAKNSFLAAGTEAQALNNLGVVYENNGEISKATEAYASAASIDPNLDEAKRNLDRIKQSAPKENP
jgi:protein O-GlcNAc transferase